MIKHLDQTKVYPLDKRQKMVKITHLLKCLKISVESGDKTVPPLMSCVRKMVVATNTRIIQIWVVMRQKKRIMFREAS